jgi:spore coat protein A, manganese oxidase
MFHPGASREHGYPNVQHGVGATQWYHDHALDVSGRNFHMGLLSFYVLEDGTEDELPLPRDEQHVQLVVTNRLFGSVG